KCGMWNAECGMAVLSSVPGALHALDAGTSIPHSEFRIPNSTMKLPDLLREFRHHLEQIPDNAVVRHLEDRRVSVLVDGHDDLGRAHPREVLDRPRNADRDVQRRADRLAGLSYLVRMGPPPGV